MKIDDASFAEAEHDAPVQVPFASDATEADATEPAAMAEDAGARERAGFSAAFYIGFYSDLRMMNLDQAELHWRSRGAVEARFGCARQVIEHHAARGVHPPEDFDAAMYLRLNVALVGGLKTPPDAAAHYLGLGQAGGLRYSPEDPAFFAALYEDADSEYSRDLRQAAESGRAMFEQSAAALLGRIGVRSTAFLALFDISDYVCLNPGLGLRNLPQCLHHFAKQGLARLAPIALDYLFDPVFYRDTNREIAGLPDAEAYRHWLETGLPRGEQPNAARFLHKLGLLETGCYPPAFEPGIYAAANPDLAAKIVGGWRLLQHCILNGINEGRPGCQLSADTLAIFQAAADQRAIAGNLGGARRIYQDVLTIDPQYLAALRHHADGLLRSGDWFNAARIYDETIRCGGSTIWTYLNLATCCVNLKRWRDAAAALQTIRQQQSGDIGIGARLRDVCRQGFEAVRAEALWLAEQGFEDRARRAMAEAVDLLCLQASGAPMSVAKAAREVRAVAIVADLGLPQCRFYRVEQKVAQLAELGVTVTVFDLRDDLAPFHQLLPSLQAVIFYRVPATPATVEAILATRTAAVPSFYEIDDLMFEAAHFPDDFASYGGQITRSLYATLVTTTEQLRAAMGLCDYALASTPPLAARMAPLVRSGRAFVHRNALHAPHEAAMAARPVRSADGCIRIFYGTGTKAHNTDFVERLAPAMARLLDACPEARFIVLGYLKLPAALAPFAAQILVIEPLWNIDAYWRILGGCDINLAVLAPGPVADCKSEIKWLEAAMLGLPSIVSSTATYEEVVADGETGLLATTPEDWYRALKRLVRSPEARQRIGAGARRAALAAYGMAASVDNLRQILKDVAAPSATARTRRRVLLVNVYFPPQAVGGATRVVADNARDLQRLYGDEIEVEVFAAVEGSPLPYRLSRYLWNGIPVTGVTTPDDPEIDSRHTDEGMRDAFATCLDRFQPDIIHFHCIQRLSFSVCDLARARRIPYVVTMHDGWWVSDTQFLVDRVGALDLYDYAKPLQELARHGARRFDRLSRCADILADAAQVLTVSHRFAEVLARCGVPNLRVIANGLPSVALAPRKASPDGRVRLAHIGGVSLHKGYTLFKAAVMLSDFRNLEVLVIDHAVQPGVEQRASWGTTPVRIRGKLPQAEVADLYSAVDVLVAPSVWPESYGLVVREALAAGCWVVTSDRGALGEDVTPGCGHVVSVESYEPLQAVLGLIDASPARYSGPIESQPVLRQASDQAVELAALYLELETQPKADKPAKMAPARRRLPARVSLA